MQQKQPILKKADPKRFGVYVASDNGILIQTILPGDKQCGILLTKIAEPDKEPIRLDFTPDMFFGNVCCCRLYGIEPEQYAYTFHVEGRPVSDVYSKECAGHKLFGMEHFKAGDNDRVLGSRFREVDFDWEDDKKPGTPYEDSFYYGLHVRGFTMDPSSGVREAGTYTGVIRKIPYLKKLGVTGVVLQPVYEFEECIPVSPLTAKVGETRMKVNYWGYVKGDYFAPKNAYAYTDNAVNECKEMIRDLHKAGIEVILQFYFPPEISMGMICEILDFWSVAYHVDGFHLLGTGIRMEEIAKDPYLVNVKIWAETIPTSDIYGTKTPHKRTFACFERGFMDNMRCYLKGDENKIQDFLFYMRRNPEEIGVINYLASYGGFRLADVFSYERKHNEDNGEKNQDGETYNCSWNCGAEGPTGKRNIKAFRMRMIKNALSFLFLAQGTPFLFMGDECGKTSLGNNNPYCQDNEISWKQWKLKKSEKEILDFTVFLAELRKNHPILHRSKECRLMDTKRCGVPDLSYHGKEAWKPDMNYYIRHIAMMLCGLYEERREGDKTVFDNHFYLSSNMHWEEHTFALPRLPIGRKWSLLYGTQDGTIKVDQDKKHEADMYTSPPRSLQVFICEAVPVKGKADQKKQ